MVFKKEYQLACGMMIGHHFEIKAMDPHGQWCELECTRCGKPVRCRTEEALEEQFK